MRSAFIFLLLVVMLIACERRPPSVPPADGLTAAERAAEPPASASSEVSPTASGIEAFDETEAAKPPIAASQVRAVRLSVVSESGYLNEKKEYMIDVLERDMAYLTLKVETPDGRPVIGAEPSFVAKGGSRVIATSSAQRTDESGTIEFGVIGGKMGTDHVTASYRNASSEVLVNVISLQAAGYAALDEIKGALRWDDLTKARLRFGDEAVTADFPPAMTALNGKTVKLIGFMMPLEPEQKQKHFLLTSNPPSCFFHVPGGPAGAVEVFADRAIEASWDPVVLEGRFETMPRSEIGVIYRLHQARQLSR